MTNGLDSEYKMRRRKGGEEPVAIDGLSSAQRLAAEAGALRPPEETAAEPVDRIPTTVDGPASTVDDEPAARPTSRRRRKPPEEHWSARHVRRTFHLPNDVSAAFDAEVAADEDLSLAVAATEAIEAWLARRRRTNRR